MPEQSEPELELWRRRRLLEMQKRLQSKQEATSQPTRSVNPEEAVSRLFVGRAQEVWNVARRQYPQVMVKLSTEIARLAQNGQLKGPITGEQLFWFLRTIGLRVRLDTKIQVLESGELKSLTTKLRGN